MENGIRQVAGVVLAGGLARRMGGGDKPLLAAGGATILGRVIERLAPQVGTLILNANGDQTRFAGFGLPVVPDGVGGYAGPLAGILAGLDWVAEHRPDLAWVVSAAADTPLLPTDLVERLLAALGAEGAEIACAVSGGRLQPVFALWPVNLRDQLRRALVEEGLRKAETWVGRFRAARVEWPGGEEDPFFNVNTPEDLARLRGIVEGPRSPSPTSSRGA